MENSSTHLKAAVGEMADKVKWGVRFEVRMGNFKENLRLCLCMFSLVGHSNLSKRTDWGIFQVESQIAMDGGVDRR